SPSSENVSPTPDEASLSSNESVSSHSSTGSTSETPPEKTKNPHGNTTANPQNSG
ncbi:rho GTPase-activating protein 10 isoform X1, partial [Tachysurus ichikawai]